MRVFACARAYLIETLSIYKIYLYRKYIYIEIKSMFENFSMLVQSVKGLGKCAHFPTVALMLLRGRMFRDLFRWSCSPLLPKSSLINCLDLWFFRSIERTYISSAYYLTLAPFVARVYIYLNTIIKKATKIL